MGSGITESGLEKQRFRDKKEMKEEKGEIGREEATLEEKVGPRTETQGHTKEMSTRA